MWRNGLRLIYAIVSVVVLLLGMSPALATNFNSRGGIPVTVRSSSQNITCTAAFIRESYLLTAGHCGEEGAEVIFKGKVLGLIKRNLLVDNSGLDIAFIMLSRPLALPSVSIDCHWDGNVGDELVVMSPTLGAVTAIVESGEMLPQRATIGPLSSNVGVFDVRAALRPGDSGAPVYYNDRLVGLVHGGDLRSLSLVTPIGDTIPELCGI